MRYSGAVARRYWIGAVVLMALLAVSGSQAMMTGIETLIGAWQGERATYDAALSGDGSIILSCVGCDAYAIVEIADDFTIIAHWEMGDGSARSIIGTVEYDENETAVRIVWEDGEVWERAVEDARPDLVVTDFWREEGVVRYQVRNIGGSIAAAFVVELVVDGMAVASEETAWDLGPGERWDGAFDVRWTSAAREAAVGVRADSDDTVPETDEENNERWETWMCDEVPPVIVAVPTVEEVTEDSVVIVWETDEVTSGLARFDSAAGRFGFEQADPEQGTTHVVALTSLRPSTTYHFVVESIDSGGNIAVSGDLLFMTKAVPDVESPQVSILDPGELSGTVILTADASDESGVERVEFYLDGEHVFTDYSAPFEWNVDTTAYVDGDYKLTTEAFDLSGNHAVDESKLGFKNKKAFGAPMVEILSPADGAKVTGEIKVDVLISDPDGIFKATLYADIDNKAIIVDQEVFESKPTLIQTSFTWDSCEAGTSNSRLTVEATDVALIEATASAAGGTPGTFTGGIGRDSIDVDTINPQCDKPPHLVVTARSLARVGSAVMISITVKNIGGKSAEEIVLRDRATLFQPLASEGSKVDYVARFNPETMTGECEITDYQSLGKGQSRIYTYIAVPVLLFPTSGLFARFADEVEFSYEGVTGTKYTRKHARPISTKTVSGMYRQALKHADYLIVTDPKKLFQDEIVFQAKTGPTPGGTSSVTFVPPSGSDVAKLIGGLLGSSDPNALGNAGLASSLAAVADHVYPLLSSMGELASLKNGALGYLDCSAVPDGLTWMVLRTLIQPQGDWAKQLHPSFSSPTGGYLLIVGEDHIVPAKKTTVLNAGETHVVRLSDHFYSNADLDAKEIPDLVVGRIIGNGADALRIPIETSIGVFEGESGYAFDRDEALLISGQGMGAFYNVVYEAASILSNDFTTIDQMHWRDYYEVPKTGFFVTFDPDDGLAAGHVAGWTDSAGKPIDDIVIADASAHMIRLYDAKGGLKKAFAVSWWQGKKVDGFVVGDLVGDSKDEIILADSSANQIWAFDFKGNVVKKMTGIDFDPMDGLAVGDVLGDGTRQVIIARQKTDRLLVYRTSGAIAKNHVKGFDKHDVLLVGDIVKDGKNRDEIIMVDRDANAVRVFDENGALYKYHDWVKKTEDCSGNEMPYLEFYDYDEASCKDVGGSGYAIGNCRSGGRDEIIVAPGATYRDIFLCRSLSFVADSIPFDFKPYDGLAIGEFGDVLGVAQEEIVIGDAANDRIIVLDVDNWVKRAHADLPAAVEDKDLIFWAGHGNKTTWGGGINSKPPDSTANFASLDFTGHNPVVNAVGSCYTGNYDCSPDNAGVSEMFLRSGAGVYIGNTEGSFGPSEAASLELHRKWKLGTSIGDAFADVERMVLSGGQPLRADGKKRNEPFAGWLEWALKCNLYGDPKFDVLSAMPCSLVTTESDEEPSTEIDIVVPDYSVEKDHFGNGLDRATIPGGILWQAGRDPWVPVYVHRVEYPAGYSVRTVRLVERTEGDGMSGVSLPAAPLNPTPGGYDVEPAASTASGWFPRSEFAWDVLRYADGTSTLLITVYPFQYNALTTDVRFFGRYRFDVEYEESAVAISRLGMDVDESLARRSSVADIHVTNVGEPRDVVASVVIERCDDALVVGGPDMRTLKGLTGNASFSVQSLLDGREPGDYRIVTTLRDPDSGTVLSESRAVISLGTPSLELTGIDCDAPVFEPGDQVRVRLACRNNGSVDVAGTLILMILDETGEMVRTFEEEFTDVSPGASWAVDATWDTSGTDGRGYLALGYAEYDGGRTAPVSCVFAREGSSTLLFDDFEDDVADGWRAPSNWAVVEEDDSLALAGRDHSFAVLETGEDWTDYVLRFRAKLMHGRAHLCFRFTFDGPRYLISWGAEDLRMHLTEAQHFEDLAHLASGTGVYDLGVWHDVEIRVEGSSIEVHVNGVLEIEYEDADPILSGTIAFEPLDGSLLYIDDVEVFSVE